MAYTVEQLQKIDGKLWEKETMRRMYFNYLAMWYGLDISYYGTGNIKYAELDGETISNSRARKLASELSNGKLYYDLISNQFVSKGISKPIADDLISAIEKKLIEGGV